MLTSSSKQLSSCGAAQTKATVSQIRGKKKCCVAIFASIPIFVLSPMVNAQSVPAPGQLVPKTFAPEQPAQVAPPISFEGVSRAPENAAEITIDVGSVTIENLSRISLPTGVLELAHALDGKRVSVADVYTLAARLEALCAQQGLFLTRVLVPPQRFVNGDVLRLTVVAGHIEHVNVDVVAKPVQGRVQNILGRLVGREGITRQEFERTLLLASQIPGLVLATALSPGKTQGGLELTVTGTFEEQTSSVTIDNTQSHFLGHWNSSVSTALNSPIGWGEEFYATLSSDPEIGRFSNANPRRLFAIGASIPLDTDGLGVDFEYAWSRTHPLVAPTVVDSVSKYERWAIRLEDNFLLDRQRSLIFRASLDATDASQFATLFGVPLYDDRVRATRLGFDLTQQLPWNSSIRVDSEVSYGFRGLGSRGISEATFDAPVSQPGSGDTFVKGEYTIQADTVLSNELTAQLTARGQLRTGRPLVLSEKFVLGGENDLSGTDDAGLSGDRGWLLRTELQWNPHFPLATIPPGTQFYGFVARGQVTHLERAASLYRVDGASDAGVGLRLNSFRPCKGTPPIELAIETAFQSPDHYPSASRGWRENIIGTIRF